MSENITDIVELDDAINRIQRWRDYVGEEFETKAFFISLDDIIALYQEVKTNNGTGIRAYLARKDSNQNELLLVGVKDASTNPESGITDGEDILNVSGVSAIYDLSTPCPNMCDFRSALYTLSRDKEKVNLSDLPKK